MFHHKIYLPRKHHQRGRQLTLRKVLRRQQTFWKSPKTPESVRKSFKRLYGTILVIQKRTRNKKQYLFPDVSVSEPIVTSIPIRTVTVETTREYSLTDATTQNDLPYPLTVRSVATSQRDRVGLGVGGKMFVTSRITLMNYPKTLLFKLVDIRDSLIVYFVDRDPEFFYIILHFYRVGVRNVPTYPTIHRKLQIEVDFYELNSLADITYNCRNICGNCKEYIYCIVIYNV